VRLYLLLFLTSIFLIAAAPARADVKLSPLFGDNMVLQRNIAAPMWGAAEPGERITVELLGQRVAATADAQGRWKLKLPMLRARGPFDVTVTGKNTVTLHNVVVGEVWVCSGQSNMEWIVQNSNDAAREIATANYPLIRMFTVQKALAAEPKTELAGQWAVSSPQTAARFSAVAYFFGRELHKKLGVPIGLIHSSWGGTPAEVWTSRPALESDPLLKPMVDTWRRDVAAYAPAKADYERKLAQWQQTAEQAKAAGLAEPAKPVAPLDPNRVVRVSSLYNAMIAPLIPYGIKGVIWYQGESNADRVTQYRTLFPTLIKDWRRNWGAGDFPFLFVQLANYMAPSAQPSESAWADLREAQTKTLALPRTGMAVAIDIGAANDIHPRNKQEVGRRLALVALATQYGHQIEYSGPMYDGMKVEGNKIRLRFKHTSGGLMMKDMLPASSDGAEYPDVPQGHWTYDAIALLSKAGVIVGRPDGVHRGQWAMTRYEFAVAIARSLQNGRDLKSMEAKATKRTPAQIIADCRANGNQANLQDTNDLFVALAHEFAPELSSLGVRVMIEVSPNLETAGNTIIPFGHWAYKAIETLERAGGLGTVFDGRPMSAGSTKQPMTRYEFAVGTARLLDGFRATIAWGHLKLDPKVGLLGGISYRDADEAAMSLVREFADQLARLGIYAGIVTSPQSFAIAGQDRKFVWANARIEGDTIVVWSDQVLKPSAVRYAWANNPAANLYNGAGLPAVPFRTDDVPKPTDISKAPPVETARPARPDAKVARGHWAYMAMEQLSKAGLRSECPFPMPEELTRYEFTVAIARLLDSEGKLTTSDQGINYLVIALKREFGPELSRLGVRWAANPAPARR